MNFKPMRGVYPDMAMWGAEAGAYTFIISNDKRLGPDALFYVSAKFAGSKPFEGQRFDIGGFKTFFMARQACEEWHKAKVP